MKKIIAALMFGLATLGLGGCDMSGGQMMDPVVRAMASDEQIARFEDVIVHLRNDDVEALKAIAVDGTSDEAIQGVVDYFPNEEPNAILFTTFTVGTNFSSNGRTRREDFAAIVEFDHGSYDVRVTYSAQGDDPLRLLGLNIYPMFEEEVVEEEAESASKPGEDTLDEVGQTSEDIPADPAPGDNASDGPNP